MTVISTYLLSLSTKFDDSPPTARMNIDITNSTLHQSKFQSKFHNLTLNSMPFRYRSGSRPILYFTLLPANSTKSSTTFEFSSTTTTSSKKEPRGKQKG